MMQSSDQLEAYSILMEHFAKGASYNELISNLNLRRTPPKVRALVFLTIEKHAYAIRAEENLKRVFGPGTKMVPDPEGQGLRIEVELGEGHPILDAIYRKMGE